MEIYFITLVIVYVLNLIKIRKSYYLIISMSLLTVVLGCRDVTVGTDTENYHIMFYQVSNLPFEFMYLGDLNVEIGFRTLIKILSLIGDSPQLLIFISSAIMCAFFGLCIYKNIEKRYYYLAILFFVNLGFYFQCLNLIRQMIAISIGVNSLQYLKNHKYKKASVIIVCALLFHQSALLMALVIPLYYSVDFLVRKKINIILIVAIYTFAFMCAYYFLDKYVLAFVGEISDKFSVYLYGGLNSETFTFDRHTLEIIFMLMLGTFFINEDNEKTVFCFFSTCFLAGSLIDYIATKTIFIISRLALYFQIFNFLSIPFVIPKIKGYYMRNFILMILLVEIFASYFNFCIEYSDKYGVVYKAFF